ncbi:hypothetical protein [Arthrobacter rhizosphaerae]|nr:hypothetical protein [Arthrobacter rhizosphaerae]
MAVRRDHHDVQDPTEVGLVAIQARPATQATGDSLAHSKLAEDLPAGII